MTDQMQAKAEAMADQAALAEQVAAGQAPVHRATDNAGPENAMGTAARRPRGRGKKPAPPAPKRRAAGLLSHESHTRDIPAVAAELDLPVHTVRRIVTRAIQEWQSQNPVEELVRLYFASRLKKPIPAE
jgi:hypothetical protein